MESETASLTLRTWDILPNNNVTNNTDNSIGRITANNARITWKNINLRHVLGSLWDRYDKFNMILNFYGMKVAGVDVAVNDRSMSFWISGLNFSNQTYNITTKSLNNDTCIGVVLYTAGLGVSQTLLDNVITINKPDIPVVDITIEMKCQTTNVADGFTEKPASVLGHHTFGFTFVGCEDYKKSDVVRRI